MSSIEERIYAAVADYRTVWPEPWPLSPNLMLMVEAVETLERVEEQIHEDGGFIDQIVGLEEENARLRELLEFVITPGQGGVIAKPCNCGFGGFHDDGNPRCDRNGA